MDYVLSDIHGNFELFSKLLKKIKFSKNDCLYICGDIIDKGNDSENLIKYIVDILGNNCKCIKGNHEVEFCKFYNSLAIQKIEEDILLNKCARYLHFRGNIQRKYIDFLLNLPLYIEAKDFICVHAGVQVDKNGNVLALEKTPIESLVYNRVFCSLDTQILSDKCIFFGHTPTYYITNNLNGSILVYPKNSIIKSVKDYSKIHLDTGNSKTHCLGCFCVDTCKAIFVQEDED